jgi:hypothetical protein
MQLQRAMVAIVGQIGASLLANGKLSQICAALDVYSNATVTYNAVLDGEQCRTQMTMAAASNLTMSFEGRRVVLEAWSAGSPG